MWRTTTLLLHLRKPTVIPYFIEFLVLRVLYFIARSSTWFFKSRSSIWFWSSIWFFRKSSTYFTVCFLHVFPSLSFIYLKILNRFYCLCLKLPWSEILMSQHLWCVCGFLFVCLFYFLFMVLYFLVQLVNFYGDLLIILRIVFEKSLGLRKKMCSLGDLRLFLPCTLWHD